MPIDFYYHFASPPCWSVLLTAKMLGVDLNLKLVDMSKQEHMKPEFLAINPEHCIPTIVDGEVKLWESRAICSYLVNQYGRNDSLYPTNPKLRCVVDQRLYFDSGKLYQSWADYAFPPVLTGKKPDPAKLEKTEEALKWLDGYLNQSPWSAGNTMTIADVCLVASVSSIQTVGITNFQQYPNVQNWLVKCKKEMTGFEDVIGRGAKTYGEYFKAKLESLRSK